MRNFLKTHRRHRPRRLQSPSPSRIITGDITIPEILGTGASTRPKKAGKDGWNSVKKVTKEAWKKGTRTVIGFCKTFPACCDLTTEALEKLLQLLAKLAEKTGEMSPLECTEVACGAATVCEVVGLGPEAPAADVCAVAVGAAIEIACPIGTTKLTEMGVESFVKWCRREGKCSSRCKSGRNHPHHHGTA